ncbi:hypothetical protein [Alteriqipengyuania lutimaris]|uniref:Uncharacterized protein n=1 Tax=Alteriqipengyuania lutimaris TaxID=1538146 RepID=A0A395LJF8_9SPHN|nr:hypothetical protein [Alteriqipengyuania lutimaris]MBB3033889.1 hypothetical protein [Alteriqipengyuania lutimaris]RDS77146.1 hypothetical protein DL238_05645 [Alteriqipengyuania lutimaris]
MLRYLLTLGVAAILSLPVTVSAQALVRAKIDWEAEKPNKVHFQTPATGNSDFSDRTDHYYGEETFANRIYQVVDIVVRYADGTSIPFRVRGQVGSELFSFTVRKPSGSIACNISDVERLERRSRGHDHSELVSALQSAQAMLESRDSPCPQYLERRVAKSAFDANCNLAKRTTFFDISPQIRDRLLRIYEGHSGMLSIKRQIAACEKQVRGQVLAPTSVAMQSALSRGDLQEFFALDSQVSVLLEGSDWRSGAAVVDLSPGFFEDLREQAATMGEAVSPAMMEEGLYVPSFPDELDNAGQPEAGPGG